MRVTPISPDHEYILCYARRIESVSFNGHAHDIRDFPYEDDRGWFRSTDLTVGMGRKDRPNQYFAITDPRTGHEYFPLKNRVWRFEPSSMEREIAAGNVIWPSDRDGSRMRRPRYKTRFNEHEPKGKPVSTWIDRHSTETDPEVIQLTAALNTAATRELRTIFAQQSFAYPKPVSLIQELVRISTNRDSIVLDSFAGSGTTAHAVLALNQQDSGHRRFLLVECEDYVDAVTCERVRRLIRGVPSAKDKQIRDGFGGTVSYFRLGKPMRKEAMLHPSKLPTYERLAAYVFFTATGEEFDPAAMRPKRWFIGKAQTQDVFLIYTDDFEELKDLALTRDIARRLSRGKRPKLVFAPTKYLDEETMHALGITFQQLPYEIYETVDSLSP